MSAIRSHNLSFPKAKSLHSFILFSLLPCLFLRVCLFLSLSLLCVRLNAILAFSCIHPAPSIPFMTFSSSFDFFPEIFSIQRASSSAFLLLFLFLFHSDDCFSFVFARNIHFTFFLFFYLNIWVFCVHILYSESIYTFFFSPFIFPSASSICDGKGAFIIIEKNINYDDDDILLLIKSIVRCGDNDINQMENVN